MTRILLASILALLFIHACTLEENFRTDAGTELSFSQDTVRFDTVFTEVGSATRSFKIFNPYDQPISLKSIRVATNPGGRFRINVDGLSGEELNDVFMPPNDSIYVFVEVKVDPDQDVSASPFILEGEVIIVATDLPQRVVLEAYGQNANYLPIDRTRAGFGLLTCDFDEIVFDDPKPYVLYGSLVVDECTLTLPPGAKLYVHGGLVRNDVLFPESPIFNDGIIIFQNTGKLNIQGTAANPVLIATDRLEERFQEQGGQFSGIRLGEGTGPHVISHARIRNGIVGIFVDSLSTLTISNTEISYTSSTGLVGYQANVSAKNLSIHSNGGGALQAIKGGRYRLDYCTLVNYGGQNPAVALTNGFQVTRDAFVRSNLDAVLRNTIVFGSLGDEFALVDFSEPNLLNYRLENCILKSDRVPMNRPEFADRCINCLIPASSDALFLNASRDTFLLDSMSVAIGFAQPIQTITVDLLDNQRDATTPDCGAYEFVPN